MKTGRILLLCILAAALVSTVLCSGDGPDECCFRFYPKRIKKDLIQSYQMTDERCARIGVIFVTLKGRKICVDPNQPWVEGMIRYLDEKTF